MEHERDVLTEITSLRTKAISDSISDEEKIELDGKVSGMLGRVMMAVENYPQLKANENFIQLQGALNEVEEQISAARRFYNAAVTDYNNTIEVFPSNIVAKRMNYKPKKVFEIEKKEKRNVDVTSLFQEKKEK